MILEESKRLIFDVPIEAKKYYIKNLLYRVKAKQLEYRLNHYSMQLQPKNQYVSICSIFKNEASYLREWIEYHRIIGIDHFYLYNNFSEDDYKEVLNEYVENGIVTLIEWPVKQGQMQAYSDCVNKYSSETNWIAFIDLDEYIVPNREDNIKDELKKFENRPNVVAYWRLFGTSGLMKRDKNGLVIEDFIMCWRKYTNTGKFFYNTAYDFAEYLPQNCAMHLRWSVFKGKKLPPVNFYNHVIWGGINVVDDDYPPVQINHYFTKSYEEYAEKKSRGDAFYELNPRDEEYFLWHEMKCQNVDYNIRKYMIQLKKRLGL